MLSALALSPLSAVVSVHSFFVVFADTTGDPTPTTDPDFNPDTVTPGTIGFVITLFVAIAAVLLIIDMVRRIRRVNLRQQVTEKLDAEEAAAAAAAAAADRKRLGRGDR